MNIRWGPKSTGGIVKKGRGGWTLHIGRVCCISWTDPTTGGGYTIVGWHALRNYRKIKALHRREAAEAAAGIAPHLRGK